MLRTALILVALVCLSSLFPSCGMMPGEEDTDPKWVEEEVRNGPPRRDMFTLCRQALVAAQFPPGDSAVVQNQVSSGWDVSLAPYSKQGYREKGVLEIESLGGAGRYRIRSRVQRDRNMEVHQTLEIAAAEWEPTVDNEERARVLLHHLLAFLR